jgi:two-component system, OmpR family, sensor kinase
VRLHVRLAVGTGVVMLAALAVLAVWIAKFAESYQAEVAQRLNAGIAMYVTQELALIDADGVNSQALKELAHRVMTVNPSAEVYLLGRDGEVIATLVPEERLRSKRVDLAPIQRFIRAPPERLISGDDPTAPGRRAPFSVAPVGTPPEHLGYLYVVLGGKRFDSVVAAVRGSYALKMGLAVTICILAAALAIGVAMFSSLTLPLRRLTQRMAQWADRMGSVHADREGSARSSDEISALTRQFDSMAQRIEQQIEAIETRDLQRRELVATISHDLRTPLASLHGYLETVLLKGETLSAATRREYLEIAHHHSERLERLIAALFELSKLETGAIVPAMEPFLLPELLHDVALRFRLRAQQLGIELTAHADPQAPPVRGDVALVERVLENLLDNALRHTKPGGHIRIEMQLDGEAARVAVVDTGIGISAETMPFVFEPYFHGDKQRDSSTGLGLAIVKRIVELHGQRVSMKSTPKVGTTVEFALPLAQSDSTAKTAVSQSSGAAA